MIKSTLRCLVVAALLAVPSLTGVPGFMSTAEALSLSQGPSVQRWCGPGGRLCYNPATTRWTWKKRRH